MTNLNKVRLTRNETIGIYAAIVAAFLLYYKTIYMGSRAKILELNRTIATEKADLEKTRAQLQDLSNRKIASVETEESRVVYDKYVEANASLANVVGALAKGDGRSPFSLKKIATEKQENVNGYTKTQFSIDVDASFPAIGGFLEGLELSPLLTDIQTVEISRISTELKKCSAKIKLLSYVVKK